MRTREMIVAVLLFLTCTAPQYGEAYSFPDQRATSSLRATIAQLEARIALLTAELEVQKMLSLYAQGTRYVLSVPRSNHRSSELITASFYEGSYTGLFEVRGNSLLTITPTVPQLIHIILWNRFATIAGEAFLRSHLQEFRVYHDEEATFDAFTELDPRTGRWILGVNTYGIDFSRPAEWNELNRLFLHEIGHVLLGEEPELLDTFVRVFWGRDPAVRMSGTFSKPNQDITGDSQRRFKQSPCDFVSEYAAISPLEDAVESLVVFLVEPRFGEEESVRRDKVGFFAQYPFIVAFRDRVRLVTELGILSTNMYVSQNACGR